MNRIVDQMMKNNKKSSFTLQLTAMVDMFTILIVFLLKSYSTSTVQIPPKEELKLPQSTSTTDPTQAIRMIVSKSGIFIEDKLVVTLNDGEIDKKEIDKNDKKFIRKLFEELDKQAEKAKTISDKNKNITFDGEIIFQADKELKYTLVNKILYTASMAGYADMKLATLLLE